MRRGKKVSDGSVAMKSACKSKRNDPQTYMHMRPGSHTHSPHTRCGGWCWWTQAGASRRRRPPRRRRAEAEHVAGREPLGALEAAVELRQRPVRPAARRAAVERPSRSCGSGGAAAGARRSRRTRGTPGGAVLEPHGREGRRRRRLRRPVGSDLAPPPAVLAAVLAVALGLRRHELVVPPLHRPPDAQDAAHAANPRDGTEVVRRRRRSRTRGRRGGRRRPLVPFDRVGHSVRQRHAAPDARHDAVHALRLLRLLRRRPRRLLSP